MDNSQYPTNVIGTSASSYPSPAAISPHQLQNGQLQQNGPLPPHTLPPLQPQMQSVYGSHPHTPRTPGTPNPPTPSNTMSNYPPPPTQPAGRGYPMMNPYPQPPHPGYATSASMMPQSSVAATHPQPIAPAPATRPPVLRPMPAGGVMPQSGLSSPYAQSPLMPHQQPLLQDTEQPTHVVGSQGRRGILPSAPGRPAAPTGAGAAAKTVIPQKDADGKFPCPHCTKTYLHAKHLKRHLLRHTGDRPYMCVLCRDTFSRSDILKRHFQKCSIRRGNPTGASHLSHPQAHVKKHQQAQQKAAENDMNQLNGMNGMHPENGQAYGMVPMTNGMSNMVNDPNQMSRASSMGRMDDPNNRDRTTGAPVYGGEVQGTMASNINPQLANYSMPQPQNGMPMFGQSSQTQQNLDWSMFQGAQDTYVNSFQPPNLGQTQIATRTDSNSDAERAAGVLGAPPNDVNDRSLFFSNWETPSTMHDPYQELSSQILNFFSPPGIAISSQTTNMNEVFSPTNVKDFLEKYTHFHVHFSFLHIPTFRIMDAYTGLLAAMCCVGACYSERLLHDQVREAMDILKTSLERDSGLVPDDPRSSFILDHSQDKNEVERLQALLLLVSLLTWNGTPEHRESARRLFPLVANIARRSGLLSVSRQPPLFSPLHQPDFSLAQFVNPEQFDWASWINQERRIRLMHLLYLSDVSQVLFFNTDSQFDSFELKIPLPADDAAWEAQTAIECAEALHLYGSDAAKARNPDGSQRSKQPELDLALKTLLHESYQIHPGSTNLYGKFILIHCLIAQILRAQAEGRFANPSSPATPLSQIDWIFKSGPETGSSNTTVNNNGEATPTTVTNQNLSPAAYQTFGIALDKFKSNWDMDMAIQFPPSVQNLHRYGFSRDGIHYYWLARWLLTNTRPEDLQLVPDQRFTRVIHVLKSIKDRVIQDGAARGEELGSISDIDNNYGVDDLTLNMASLFRPLPLVVESPGMSPVKTEI